MTTPNVRRALALLVTSASLFAAAEARAACDRRVDRDKVVLFVDTNFGLAEMKAAEEAACDRGESFVRVPAPIEGEEDAFKQVLKLDGVEYEMEKLYAAQETQKCGQEDENRERCATIANRMTQLTKMYEDSSGAIEAFVARVKNANGGGDFVYRAAETAVQALAARGAKITSVVGSGHSGGASFGGRFGGIHFSYLQNAIRQAYANQPARLAEFGSVFLWGCNTNNPHMPEQWMALFPSLSMVAGFQGSAPSNVNPASRRILADLIRKEGRLEALAIATSDDAEIKRAFDQVDGIAGSVAAVYLRDVRGGRGWFYERVMEDTDQSGQRWVTRVLPLVSAQQCEPLRAEIGRDQEYVSGILAGETPISAETASGTLRAAYTRSRRNDACRAKLGFPHSANRIGLALFWHGVKKNAMRLLAPETAGVTRTALSLVDDPSAIERAVEAANAEAQQSADARIAALRAERIAVQARIDEAKGRISGVAAAESLLPWTKKRARELKRYVRREKKFSRKLAKGRDVQGTLDTIRAEIARYEMAKRISERGSVATTAHESEIGTQEARIAAIDAEMRNAAQGVRRATSARVREELGRIARSFSPKSVEEIAPMGYAEVLALHRDRSAAIARLEQEISSSRQLMTALAGPLARLKSWNQTFQMTVIDLKDECMDFMAWHEYVAAAGAAAQPRVSCQ